jgi:glycosyltransferase involved in cell wall biosynthesis
VHAPTPLAPPRRRTPLVVTIHDAVPWTHPETLTPRGVAFHRRMVERAARTADAVVVPTQSAGDELVAAVPALRGRCQVVPPGLWGALELPPDADARRVALGLPPEGFLLSVATLEPRKGLDVLVEALADPAAPGLPLLVAGQPGWGGIDLAALCRSHGLDAGRVRALGRVADADLAVLYRDATALVVPSRSEGFGLPVLEAMAAGLPVVASDVPALREVGGDAVVLVRPGDPAGLAGALAELADRADVRARLSASGLRRADDFSWERSARRLWQLYDGLG